MAEVQRESAKTPLPVWKEWFFGTGTLGMTMCNSVMNTFYFYFLTNVVMMAPALMAIITTVSRFASVFYAPIKGVIMGKKEWKRGKYGVYLKFWEPLGRAVMVLCFVNMQASQSVQFIYYVGIFVIAGFLLSFPDTATLASMQFLTTDAQQAVRLSSKKSVVATFGQVLSSLLTVRLVVAFGQGDQGKGYFMVYLTYSILAVIGYWLTSGIVLKNYDFYKVQDAGLEEKARIEREKKAAEEANKEKIPFSVYLKAYTTNFSPIALMIGDACKASASLLYSGSITYYLTYYVGDASKLTLFLFTANMGLLLGSWCCPTCVRLFGRKMTNVFAYGGFGVALILAHFIGVGEAWAIIMFVGIGRFFSGLNASIVGAFYVDIADEYEYRSGYNMTPFFMSMGGLSWTIASVCCGTIVGGTLARVGFNAAAEVTQPMLDAMLNLMTFIPGIPLAIGTVIFVLGYNLTDKKMAPIRAELAERRKEKIEQ